VGTRAQARSRAGLELSVCVVRAAGAQGRLLRGLRHGCVAGGWLQYLSARRVLGRGRPPRVTATAQSVYALNFLDALDFSFGFRGFA
jgi:hypothetical protein